MRCEEKKAYDYYLDAGLVVSFFKRKGKKLYIYLCKECSKFHLTSKPFNEQFPEGGKKKKYRDMGIWSGKCIKEDQECDQHVSFRVRYSAHYCGRHYRLKKLEEKQNMDIEKLKKAHEHSTDHRADIELSDTCGCFYCLNHFDSSEISEWIDGGETALCPRCGIDSVLPGNTGYLDDEWFFSDMHNYWFRQGTKVKLKDGKIVSKERYDDTHEEID